MRSTMAMTLASFGVVLLGFAFVIFVISLLGFQFNARDEWGTAGILALVSAIIGGALYAAGITRPKSSE